MALLLDTHALIWLAEGSPKLTSRARNAIGSLANEIYVSAASAWEVATKVRLGKLPEAIDFSQNFRQNILTMGLREMPISVAHAQRAGAMAGLHSDPFDRMLIAQAMLEGLILVSNDEALDSFGVHRLW